ncbi:MAG: hypothetical protein ACXIUD_01700 [Mongoliitalea sp.]
MRKLKMLGFMGIVSLGIMSFVWKFELLKLEGPRQELVFEEKNEDFQVAVYRERFITGTSHQGFAVGPQMLQKSGDLKEVLGVLMDVGNIELKFKDERQYNADIKTSKPLKLLQGEIAALVLDKMGLLVEKEEKIVSVQKLSVVDWDKATDAKKEMGPGVLTYREVKNNSMNLFGYTLNEVKKELEDLFPEAHFSTTSDQSNQPLYLTFSDIRKIDRVLAELAEQGIALEESSESRDFWRVYKKD